MAFADKQYRAGTVSSRMEPSDEEQASAALGDSKES
jgi:hypothetical protein